MGVGGSGNTGFDTFQHCFKALGGIPGDQHGIEIPGTPELLAFFDPLTNHLPSVLPSTCKSGRHVSRFTSVVGSSTSGKRRPLFLILPTAIFASCRPISIASTRTLVSDCSRATPSWPSKT